MQDIITACIINPSYRHDYSSIQLKIVLSKFERQKGLWKFNDSLQKEKIYLELVNSIIQEEKQKYAIPVYALDYLLNILDNLVNFTITDGEFLAIIFVTIISYQISYKILLNSMLSTPVNYIV